MSKAKTPPQTSAAPNEPDWQQLAKTHEDNWKRALSDYQNLLRRVEQEKKDFTRLSNANLIARLLPSLDIIDLAATHTQDLGVEMAAKQFRQALSEEGLTEISPQPGTLFDHSTCECCEAISTSDPSQDNQIAELSLKGYKLGEFVLRPAKVKVYKYSPPPVST